MFLNLTIRVKFVHCVYSIWPEIYTIYTLIEVGTYKLIDHSFSVSVAWNPILVYVFNFLDFVSFT